MQTSCRRGHVLEIAENASGIEQPVNLLVQRALALMDKMMDCETGNDGIETAQGGKRVVEIVGDDGYPGFAGKSAPGGLEHGWGEVERDRIRVMMLSPDQRQQASVPGAKIKDAARSLRYPFQEGGLTLVAVIDGVGALQIIASVLAGCPQVYGFTSGHEGKV